MTQATISVAGLRDRIGNDEKLRVLDVRTPGEFAAGRIAGSHNIPLGDLAGHTEALSGGAVIDLVVVCQSGGRATRAAEQLRASGHERVSVLSGGIAAWEGAGGVVEGGGAAWTIERQVRLVAGSLVLGGILASLKFPKAKFLSGAIGGGLTFAALSNTCLMGSLLAKLPHNRTGSADVEAAVAALTS
ncbi:MAG TPA: rhodanese-like domain-containing protein [Sporichthyaceae bacterium]|jgi:rhodanese-related sulfurtransferase|nr:rhodanese-like domain-containing protein [Sporichthyaceae bacterium]